MIIDGTCVHPVRVCGGLDLRVEIQGSGFSGKGVGSMSVWLTVVT